MRNIIKEINPETGKPEAFVEVKLSEIIAHRDELTDLTDWIKGITTDDNNEIYGLVVEDDINQNEGGTE